MTPSLAEADDTTQRRKKKKAKKARKAKAVAAPPAIPLPGRANPRFIVTSLKAEDHEARALYEKRYCARGEAENHIKECQLDLFADRTSSHTMRANRITPVVRFTRLRADERAPAHRPDQHPPRRRDLWHDLPEAAQDRRSGEDQFPRSRLDGLGFSLRRRLRGGLGGAALGRLTTPRPTGDLSTK